MHAKEIIIATLLTGGVGVELLCCLGLFVARDVWERLHYLGPASTVGPVLFAAAASVQEGWAMATVKIWLIALAVLMTAPILTHATARSAHARRGGEIRERPEDGG